MKFLEVQTTTGEYRHIVRENITQVFEQKGSTRISMCDGSYVHVEGLPEDIMDYLMK